MTETTKGKERREHARHVVCSAAELEVHHESTIALIHNISSTGALLLTRHALDVGEDLDVTIYITTEETITEHAKVARCERLDAERMGLWGYEVGVRFDEELHDYAEALERLNASV